MWKETRAVWSFSWNIFLRDAGTRKCMNMSSRFLNQTSKSPNWWNADATLPLGVGAADVFFSVRGGGWKPDHSGIVCDSWSNNIDIPPEILLSIIKNSLQSKFAAPQMLRNEKIVQVRRKREEPMIVDWIVVAPAVQNVQTLSQGSSTTKPQNFNRRIAMSSSVLPFPRPLERSKETCGAIYNL